jgi:hypothetical protein
MRLRRCAHCKLPFANTGWEKRFNARWLVFCSCAEDETEETQDERRMDSAISFRSTPGPKRRVRSWEKNDNWQVEWVDGYQIFMYKRSAQLKAAMWRSRKFFTYTMPLKM